MVSHLQGHFDQHQQLLDADPQRPALHGFGDVGPLHVLKAAQQLREEEPRGRVAIAPSSLTWPIAKRLRRCGGRVYLQSLGQLFASGDVGNVNGGAKSVQHLHFLQDVSAAGGTEDQQLPALMENQTFTFASWPQLTDTHSQTQKSTSCVTQVAF